MKTAVEWLEEQMRTWGDLPVWMRDDIVKQAKEMEKEQIMEAHIEGFFSEPFKSRKGQAEQYYNETFKSE
jgi:hypothetical protein